MMLPQALEGVAAVGLTYHLALQRRFGIDAGVLAGLALAIMPVSVAVDRSNYADSCLVLILPPGELGSDRGSRARPSRPVAGVRGPSGRRLQYQDARGPGCPTDFRPRLPAGGRLTLERGAEAARRGLRGPGGGLDFLGFVVEVDADGASSLCRRLPG